MAHYAFIDENNVVTQVIVGRNEDEVVDGISDWEAHYAEVYGQACKRTSYNSMGGKKRNPETNEMTENAGFRKNYAGIGYTYDAYGMHLHHIQQMDNSIVGVKMISIGKLYQWSNIN